jgi:beta-glucanase (GH16 family)
MKLSQVFCLVVMVALLQAIGCKAGSGDALPPSDDNPSSTDDDDSAVDDDDSAPVDDDDSAGDDDDDSAIAPVNLLLDPSFEEGASWSVWGGASLVDHPTVDGERALMATDGNGAEQVLEGLEPDTTYRLTGWAMTTGGDPMTIGVKDHGQAETKVSFTEASYIQKTLTFTTGFGSTTATIYAYKHTGTAPGYADDLSVTFESASDRVLLWADEFNGEGSLDPGQWSFEEGFVRNQELQWYQADNAFQEDGLLVIEGREEDFPNPNYDPSSNDWRRNRETVSYSSASVTTRDRFSWTYGHLVVRAKVSNLTGTWPAIWTLGVDCDWPSNGEVDVMENYGGDILANFAWGTNTPWSPTWDSSHWAVSNFAEGWVDSFHIWELEWTEFAMTIRLDGVELNTVDLTTTINGTAACEGQNPFQQPHYLLLNLALGGSAGGDVSGLNFPTRYLVDYVRIYQPK